MSFDPTDPNKKKHPRKFGFKILAPKTRQAKIHWQKILIFLENNFKGFHQDFIICLKCYLNGDVTRKFVSVIRNFVFRKSKQVEDNMRREQLE